MRKILVVAMVFVMSFASAASPQAVERLQPTIITFDAPGAGTAAGQGTQAPGINPLGVVTGFYSDSNNVMHGFLRALDGTITTFDAPGGGTQNVGGFVGTTVPGVLGGQGTYSIGINPAGTTAGFYVDAYNALHGFMRASDGTFTTFDAPGAGTGAGQGTEAGNINAAGVIAGFYIDTNGVAHSFLRAPDGTFTTFDAPSAGTSAGQGTFIEWASCLNPAGAVTGLSLDENFVVRGFVRDAHGVIAEFEAPGGGSGPGQGTYGTSIDGAGAITGGKIDASSALHGYLRSSEGTITTFDVSGTGSAPGQGTIPEGITADRAIIGNYVDESGANHGFIRTLGGTITKFDVPNAGPGSGQGTIPLTNNPAMITGEYLDDGNVIHGFVRLP